MAARVPSGAQPNPPLDLVELASQVTPDAVGVRVEGSFQLGGEVDTNLDLMLNLHSGEVDLIWGVGSAKGVGAGGAPTAGIVMGWGMPNNDGLVGPDLSYSGGDVPIPPLGVNVEAEFSYSPSGSGPVTIYIGGSPMSVGSQVGIVQEGVTFNYRLLHGELW